MGYSFHPEKFSKNEGYYEMAEEEKISEDISLIKKLANYIIITLHWGEEYVPQPAPWQIEFAHKLIDRGADIILGHHPHVLQPIEVYKGKLITYSLGNFVSDMCQELARKTLILEIKLFDGKITYEPIPCYINENYQAVFSKSYSLSNWLPKTLEQISNKEYQQRVRESIRDFRREFYRFLTKNFYKYPSRCLFEIFLDFLKRRLCKIY